MTGINTRIMKLVMILLLVALSGLVSAQQTTGQQLLSSAFPSWLPLIAIALVIGYGISAIAYMISTVFRTPELAVWAKSEVFEVTASAFLVLILIIAVGMIDNVYVVATGTTPLQASVSFTSASADKLLGLFVDTMWLNTALGTLTGIPVQYGGSSRSSPQTQQQSQDTTGSNIATGTGGPSRMLLFALYSLNTNYYPFSGASSFLTFFGTLQAIALFSASISVLANLALQFIQAIAIPVLIPFGLFLSIFSITRKMGRTLMAFGVGLYVFVPASILISQAMFNSAYNLDYTNRALNPLGIPPINYPGEATSFTNTVLGLFGAQVAATVTAAALFLPQIASPQVFYAPPCLVGAATYAATNCVGTGYGYPFCYIAEYIVGLFQCELSKPITDYPLSFDLESSAFNSLTSTARISYLDSYLDANVPPGLYPAIAAPGIAATAGLVSNLIWPETPTGPDTTNPILSATDTAVEITTPIASYSTFLAQYYIDKALAAELTQITLDYIPYVLQFAVPILLMPIILILVTITAIRSISPAIGGEVQILGVSELI